MIKQVRWALLSVSLVILLGCSSVIERQMATHQGVRGALEMPFGQIKREFCVQQNRCIQVTDWGDLKSLDGSDPLDKLSLKLDIAINDYELQIENQYEFDPLTGDAPIVLIFPGYGMGAQHMAMTAIHMRAQGMHPLVVASPTQQQPFNFGIQAARDLAAIFAQDYADRDLYLLGFSLGSLAVTEFSRLHEPKGVIVIAPLLDFNGSAIQLIDMRRRDSRLARVIPQRSYIDGLNRLVERSEINPDKLSWNYAVQYLPDNVLVLAATHDTLSQYQDLERLIAQGGRHFTMHELTDAMYVHPALAMPLPEIEAAIGNWLSAQ